MISEKADKANAFVFETEMCQIGTEEQNEWYFFSHKDKKYPKGTRTNRAELPQLVFGRRLDGTSLCKEQFGWNEKDLGLLLDKERAPNGKKSYWIMHEYRLETNENGTPQPVFCSLSE